MTSRSILTLTITLILSAGMALAQGRPPAPGHPGMGAPRGERLADFLSLNDAQRATLDQLRDTLRATVQPIRDQQRVLRDQIREELDSGYPDPTTIGQLVIQTHTLGQQIRAAHDTFEASFKAILTPEQLARFETYKELFPRGPGNHGFDGPDGFGPGGRGPGF